MTATQNQRIKSLSTRFLGFYKNSMLAVLAGAGGLLLYALTQGITEGNGVVDLLHHFYSVGLIAYLIYLWIRINRNVHRVEFDEDFLYVILRNQDILIPLENIKEVEIKSLGGVYEVELYQAEQLGSKFYFKPSLLYPFNYKKKDKLVDLLRRNINRAQARKQPFQVNALHS